MRLMYHARDLLIGGALLTGLIVGCGSPPPAPTAETTPEAICARMTKGANSDACIKGLTEVKKRWPKAYEAAVPCLQRAEGREAATKCIVPEVQQASHARTFEQILRPNPLKGKDAAPTPAP